MTDAGTTNNRAISLATDRPPWEQQPDEGDTAYAHFITHLESGRHRRLTKTSENLTGVSYDSTRWYASIYRWRERCRAWDEEQDAERDAKRAEARHRAWEEDERIVRAGKGILGRKMQSTDPEELSAAEMISLMREVFRAERLLFDEPTENVAHSGPGGGELAVQIGQLTPEAKATRLRELADMAERMAHAAGDLDDE